MAGSKVCFPEVSAPREPYKKDMFEEYGSLGGVDISLRDGQLMTTVQKAPLAKNQPVLCACGPALPITKPKRYSLEDEPCMSEIRKMVKNVQDLKYEVTIKGGMYKTNMSSQMKVQSYRAILKESLHQDVPFSSVNVPDTLRKSLDVWNYTLKHFRNTPSVPQVNATYCGGCLSAVASPGYVEEMLLCHPAGQNQDTLSVSGFTDGETKVRVQSAQMGSPIMEIDSVTVNTKCFCGVRTLENGCSLFQVQEGDEGFTISDFPRMDFESTKPTSISLSTFIGGECVTAAQDGTIQLWDATQICRVLNTVVEPRFDCPEKWCSAQFSAHPRQLMVTDRTGITVWDTRVGTRKEQMFVLPSQLLHPTERIMVSKPHCSNPFYHLAATDHTLFIIDQRFPKKTVLLWHHLLVTPPQYMTVVAGVAAEWNSATESPADGYDDVVLLASQSYPETICHQFNVAHADRPPISTTPPWRLGAPNDLLGLSLVLPRGLTQSTISNRLRVPLTGMTAHKKACPGFVSYQAMSTGDIFRQEFVLGEQSDEKTWCGGPGSTHLSISPRSKALLHKWLKKVAKLVAQEKSPTSEKPGVKTKKIDWTRANFQHRVLGLNQGGKLGSVHSCKLCSVRRSKVGESNLNEPCHNCGLPSAFGANLFESIQKNGIGPHNVKSTDSKTIMIAGDSSETEATDAHSQLLVRLWNGEEIGDLLQKREDFQSKSSHDSTQHADVSDQQVDQHETPERQKQKKDELQQGSESAQLQKNSSTRSSSSSSSSDDIMSSLRNSDHDHDHHKVIRKAVHYQVPRNIGSQLYDSGFDTIFNSDDNSPVTSEDQFPEKTASVPRKKSVPTNTSPKSKDLQHGRRPKSSRSEIEESSSSEESSQNLPKKSLPAITLGKNKHQQKGKRLMSSSSESEESSSSSEESSPNLPKKSLPAVTLGKNKHLQKGKRLMSSSSESEESSSSSEESSPNLPKKSLPAATLGKNKHLQKGKRLMSSSSESEESSSSSEDNSQNLQKKLVPTIRSPMKNKDQRKVGRSKSEDSSSFERQRTPEETLAPMFTTLKRKSQVNDMKEQSNTILKRKHVDLTGVTHEPDSKREKAEKDPRASGTVIVASSDIHTPCGKIVKSVSPKRSKPLVSEKAMNEGGLQNGQRSAGSNKKHSSQSSTADGSTSVYAMQKTTPGSSKPYTPKSQVKKKFKLGF